MAIKFLLKNVNYFDPHFGLASLKNTPSKPIRIIITEDDVPSNFTYLDQYAFGSGNRIFEKKKNRKKDKEKKPHCNDVAKDFNEPIVYYTIAITTGLQPRAIIDGIIMEWETHGGGKLPLTNLQSYDS